MKTAAAIAPAALTLADCIVRAARGRATRDGIAFSGLLWIRDQPVAEFRNDGKGGCNHYILRPGMFDTFVEFKQMCIDLHPDISFEQEDHVVGELWDVAYLRGAK